LAVILAAASPLPAAAGLASCDALLFPVPQRDALTFWGHACCYLDVGGFGIVTDPVFQEAFTIERRHLPAPPTDSYRNARIVLVSHAHPDHLDSETLSHFPGACVILCPEPSAKYLRKLPQTVRCMRPGDAYEFPGGRIVAVAADHPGGRRSSSAAADGRALGYVIETPGGTIYYAGDTEYFDGFEKVASAFHPDIVLLNLNSHLHSLDAVRAFRETGATRLVPMHFGAYGYFFLPERKLPRDYEELRDQLGSQLDVLQPGQSLAMAPKHAPDWFARSR
jgi:L-ascorbate metabolism protein UlaG (beta-lactamase superfamily)